MTTSREFLELALSGEALTAAHLDALKTEQVKEDEYIDYKSGAIFKDRRKAARTVREYLSGFANSDGGVLVIGIEESGGRPTGIAGCDPKDVGGDLKAWATTCVTEMGARFSPPPRFDLVEYSGTQVLVCSVARSYSLVPVVEKGKPIYHFRLGDQMLRAPDYLVEDVVLGRRARPNLEVKNASAQGLERIKSPINPQQYQLEFTISIELENSGLVWAEMSQYGLILVRAFDPQNAPQKLPISLNEHIDMQAIQLRVGELWIPGMPIHYRGDSNLDRPFNTKLIEHSVRVPLALYGKVYAFVWRAALYLLAKNSAPIWYQIDFRIDSDLNKMLRPPRESLGRLPADWPGFSITRLHDKRPVVGWIRVEEPADEEGVD